MKSGIIDNSCTRTLSILSGWKNEGIAMRKFVAALALVLLNAPTSFAAEQYPGEMALLQQYKNCLAQDSQLSDKAAALAMDGGRAFQRAYDLEVAKRKECESIYSEHKRRAAGADSQPIAKPNQPQPNSRQTRSSGEPDIATGPLNCVSAEYEGRVTGGEGACMLTLSNQCKVPVVCYADMSAAHSSGRSESTSKTYHIMKQSSVTHGIRGVISCQDYTYKCQPDN
ncbi:hypothetical protein [Rhizobium sp. C4]|uniref:hypothetical protein n=1 Tax=Rhizobium sp. C4 TaxID=1349800 RepID=UPI001E54157A|nr:hypothetical protein [Rhizobium sp. C4]MCD2176107.1 hypothetical protein [Rhizobium sp. C4]